MANTFAKKNSGTNQPPAGPITFIVANGTWLIDDTTHTTYAAPAAEATFLREHTKGNGWLKET